MFCSSPFATLPFTTLQIVEEVQSNGGRPVYNKYHPWLYIPEESKPDIVVEKEVVDIVVKTITTVKEQEKVGFVIDFDKVEKEFKKELKTLKYDWIEDYSQVLIQEYWRQQQEFEETQIVLMLFDM